MNVSGGETEAALQKKRLAWVGASLAVGTALMGVKFYAWWLTGSAAILSDALESIINVVAGGFALASVIMAARPPDASHPYGHGKIEFFSAGFEGALIIVAAAGIFYTGILQLLEPRALPNLNAGLLILLAAGLLNLILGLGLVRFGRKSDSLILVADGQHLLTDVVTSAGVLAGLLVVRLTGMLWLDGLVACLVGLNILVTGWRLVRQSFHGLMDAANPSILNDLARLLIRNRRVCWVDIHQLRAWKSGNHLHVDLHLVLPRDLQMEEAHREAKMLEHIIIDHYQGKASALIHMDPCIDGECPVCACQPCETRNASLERQAEWTVESLTEHKGLGSFKK